MEGVHEGKALVFSVVTRGPSDLLSRFTASLNGEGRTRSNIGNWVEDGGNLDHASPSLQGGPNLPGTRIIFFASETMLLGLVP